MTRPVLLLHSLGLNGAEFAPLIGSLQPGRQVLTPDLGGHRSTPRVDGPLTPNALARQLVPLLESIGPVQLVGHSLGGAVASELTALRPELVVGLAVVASPPRGFPAFAERAETVDVDGTLERWFRPSVLADWPAIVGFALDCLDEFDPVSWRELWLGFADWPGSTILSGIDTPLLVVAGDQDVSTPAAAMSQILTAAGRPGSPVVIADAAHQIPLEQPRALAEVLESFWASIEVSVTSEGVKL